SPTFSSAGKTTKCSNHRPPTQNVWASSQVMPAARKGRESDVSNLDNLVLNQPTRCLYRHHITLFLAHQGAGDRRTDRQLADFHISFVVTHDLVGHLLVGFAVSDIHSGAENYFTGVSNGRDIDNDRMLQPTFDIANARLDHALLLAGRMVLSVFLEIAQFT